jgi:hypothetical protein
MTVHPSRNLRWFGTKAWRPALQKYHNHNPSYIRIGIGSKPTETGAGADAVDTVDVKWSKFYVDLYFCLICMAMILRLTFCQPLSSLWLAY